MADFVALPVYNGVGSYHCNRFRMAFRKPGDWTSSKLAAMALAADFVTSFPKYLNSPAAAVAFANRTFEGKATLRFQGIVKMAGFNAAAPHQDWVVREVVDTTRGFTGQTLRRLFLEPAEKVILGAGTAIGGPFGPIAAADFVAVNQKHFLAGRRSWVVTEGKEFGIADPNVIVIETAAIERFSDEHYNLADKVIGMEAKIPAIWVNNLSNFVKTCGHSLEVIDAQPRSGWQRGHEDSRCWYYIVRPCSSLDALKSNQEFAELIRVHPHLLPTQNS